MCPRSNIQKKHKMRERLLAVENVENSSWATPHAHFIAVCMRAASCTTEVNHTTMTVDDSKDEQQKARRRAHAKTHVRTRSQQILYVASLAIRGRLLGHAAYCDLSAVVKSKLRKNRVREFRGCLRVDHYSFTQDLGRRPPTRLRETRPEEHVPLLLVRQLWGNQWAYYRPTGNPGLKCRLVKKNGEKAGEREGGGGLYAQAIL